MTPRPVLRVQRRSLFMSLRRASRWLLLPRSSMHAVLRIFRWTVTPLLVVHSVSSAFCARGLRFQEPRATGLRFAPALDQCGERNAACALKEVCAPVL
jgi:hypothetical protein